MLRQKFLLDLAYELRQAEGDRDKLRAAFDRDYELSAEDWATIERLMVHRQFSVLRYSHGQSLSEGYIGDLAPIVVMHDDKKQEVEEDYRTVMNRFKGAI